MSLQVTSDGGRKETINSPFSARKNHDLRGMGDLPATVMAGVRLRYRQDALQPVAGSKICAGPLRLCQGAEGGHRHIQ